MQSAQVKVENHPQSSLREPNFRVWVADKGIALDLQDLDCQNNINLQSTHINNHYLETFDDPRP